MQYSLRSHWNALRLGLMIAGLMGVAGWTGCRRGVSKEAERTTPKTAPSAFSPQAHIDLIKTRPYESKGLLPVKLKNVEGLSPLVLAEGGTARAVIVPASGMPYYREVAEVLADHLRRATGTEFAIAAEPPKEGEAIYVGPVERPGTEKILERARALAPEHFIVERVPGGAILVGNDRYRSIDVGKPLTINNVPFVFGMAFCSKGTYFAAVDFLERFVGVRWYFFGPLGTCVTDIRGKTLSMPSVAYEDGPWFPCREAWGIGIDVKAAAECGIDAKHYSRFYPVVELREWGSRNGIMRPAHLNHTDCNWDKLYGKDHPEYFALRADGTRMIGEEGKEMFSSQRCYTNEAGFQQHLRNIERYLATGEGAEAFTDRLGECLPNKDFIYWAPNDGFPGCECPGCKALIDQKATVLDKNSRLIWSYVARLGKAIKEKWPEKKLCVFGAYSGATTIPDSIKLPDNIVVDLSLGSVPDCYMKEPKYRQANQELLDYFYARTGRQVSLWIYPDIPYYSTMIPYPYRAPHAQAEFIRANRNKICSVRPLQGYPINAPDLYARLLWNPDFDVDAFLDEYAAVMFGPAASSMKEFLDLCVSRWEDTRWSYLPPAIRMDQAIPEQMIWKETYPRNIRLQMQEALREALAAVPEEGIHRQRVQYMVAVTAPFFAAGKFADETVKPVIDCAKLGESPVVDGDLKEWGAARPVELKGWKGEPVEEKTEILVARDQDAVYVAGRAHESKGIVLSKKLKDPNIYSYDSVEMYFCPDQVGLAEAGMAKAEQFFQITLNARGETAVNRKTAQRTDWGAPEKFDFTSAVRPMGKGFQFEVRIPYASLGAPTPKEGRSEWFANFYRNRPRGEDKGYQAWSPTMGRPFYDTGCFGILRFSPAPLYEIDFQKVDISVRDWTAVPVPKEAAWSLKDGKLVVKVKALPALIADANTSVCFDQIPKLPLNQPVKVEWGFRYRGVGLQAVGPTVKSSYDAQQKRNTVSKIIQIVPLASDATSDWQRGALKIPDGTVKLSDITFWDLGLRLAPGADFTIEIDSIRVLADEQP